MATAKVDIEVILERIKTIFSNNLSAKITEINSDKNDGRTLASVNSGAYDILGMNTSVKNWNPFISIWINNLPESTGQGFFVAQELIIDVVLVIQDEGNDTGLYKSLLRYMKALKEVAQENWRDSELPGMVSVQSLEPLPIFDWNGAEIGKGTGVRLKTTLS